MIRTFIFFDVETTGLIKQNVMPRITELALVAVSRNSIYNTTDHLPRVLHKLLLPIRPPIQIPQKVQELTGLSNKSLEDVQFFNCETYTLIMNFIKQLTPPTCFVAYNGNTFDYPIFLREFNNIDKDLSEDILSIDMLQLIKNLFSTKDSAKEETNITKVSSHKEDFNTLLNDGYDEILSDALDSVMKSSFIKCNKSKDPVSKNRKTSRYNSNVVDGPQTSCFEKIQEINEKTPESQKIVKSQYCIKTYQIRKTSTRRKLDFINCQPPNFKLASVSKHMLGTDPDHTHTAEGDCLIMIRCAVQLGKFFVEWADSHAVPLTNYKK